MATLSGTVLGYIQAARGAGAAIASRDDYIDMVLELSPVLLSTSTPTNLYASLMGYRGVTGSKASPPRVASPVSLSMSVLADSLGSELPDGSIDFAQFQTGQLTLGGFSILNADGAMDSWVTDYGWGSTAAEWKIGKTGDLWANFETFLPFLVREEPRWELPGGRIDFEAKSGLINYNDRLQTTEFAGSGGWEGSTDLSGQTKPKLLGVRRNIPLTLVDFANLRYVVSDGADGIQALVAGYEEGFPTGGAWTLQAANGGVTLPNQPQGAPTGHFQGEKFDGGVYSAQQGKIIEELIAMVDASVTLNATDRGNFTDTAGIYIPTNSGMTLGQAMDTIRLPLGFGPYPEQDGSELRLGTIAAPAGPVAAQHTYDGSTGIIKSITARQISPPIYKVRVAYQGLDAVIDNPLALDATTVEFLSTPWRFVEAEDATILTDYPAAKVLTVFSPLDDSTQATTAATTLLNVFKVPRWRYNVRLLHKWFHSWIGDVVQVTYPDRFDLDSGKFLLMTGFNLTAGRTFGESTYIMECWG